MDTRGKIAVACGLGGGIGALVALQMNPLFWWVGLLVGGLVGYLSYEFKQVLQAVPVAWKATKKEVMGYDWRLWSKVCLETFGLQSAFILPLIIFFWLLALLVNDPEGFLISIVTFTLLATTACCLVAALAVHIKKQGGSIDHAENLGKYNLLSVYFYHLPRFTWKYVIKKSPKALVALVRVAKMTASFVKHLFFLIHSQLRLLCAADSALGAGIGYFYGNAVVGALAGAVIGVLNFEVISKRLLKLVSIKTE